MGTNQPSLLTHFAVTEDMPGRRRKEKAVGSDAPAPAGAHGLVATPDASVPAQGAVLTDAQKERSAVNRALALQRKAEKEGRGGAPDSVCASSTSASSRQAHRDPPQGLGKGMAAQGNSESWNQVNSLSDAPVSTPDPPSLRLALSTPTRSSHVAFEPNIAQCAIPHRRHGAVLGATDV